MKTHVPTFSAVTPRSMLVLGFACTLAALTPGLASAQDSSSTTTRSTGTVDLNKSAVERPKLTADETDFVKMAAAGNLAEVQLAKLALKNGESKGVKDFAEMMIKDHGKANADLMSLAQRENLTDFKPTVMEKDKEMYKTMESLKGAAFDEAYIKNAVEDHKKDLTDYKEARNKVSSKEVLTYLTTTEPVINEHYSMAKKLEKGEAKQ